MSDSIEILFGIDALPDDLWEVLASGCPESLQVSNSFHIREYFPPALTSAEALVRATLYDSELRSVTPIQRMLSPTYVGPIAGFFTSEELNAYGLVRQQWEQYEIARLNADPLSQVLASTPEAQARAVATIIPSTAQMESANLNQAVRALQQNTHDLTASSFMEVLTESLLDWASRDLEFSMRPLHTMSVENASRILSSSPLAGLPNTDMLLNQSQASFLATMHNLRIRTSIFHRGSPWPISPGPEPDTNRTHAQQWLSFSGNAALRGPNSALILAHRRLPPWLLVNSQTRYAIRVSPREQYDSLLLKDDVYEIRLRALEDESADVDWESAQDFSREDFIRVQVIAMGFTLISALMKLGSGNRKPKWIHTPMNTVTLAAYAKKLKELSL